MDYPCAEFGDFSFSRFGFIVRTDRQTDRQTESQTRMNAILTRLPSTSVIIIIIRNAIYEGYIIHLIGPTKYIMQIHSAKNVILQCYLMTTKRRPLNRVQTHAGHSIAFN